ncbi:M20/M25/M40 family metallo-hydrolase [Mongoliitalea daihaiensis]|uniref:M20/M25/M40 family metallo-hydrolase n=1 Tax=Mongoliitalea daihaiensis TaxID=2782006 RepID=UPI001F183626|nr:M20/M25/M40 family metallo-hydrolase [Mongoliitalea daihaiensis]UJP65589.1 M20/M25/M40 family metallo-hydrolase [Mongoliitalea daihaiensis]
MPNTTLLHELAKIKSTSGDESSFTKYVIDFINKRKETFKVLPEVYADEKFYGNILLKFGKPRTAVFAHLDTIGFMVRYANQLVPIGGPEAETGYILEGEDDLGPIRCTLIENEGALLYDFPRAIQTGTRLSFGGEWKIDADFITGPYLDNKLGVYNALQLCEVIEDGWIVFSTYEEHGGGSIPALLHFIQKTSPIKHALISDITWVTDGVHHHEGVVVSIRDKHIPRKKFIDRIMELAIESGVPFQLEVEASGSSDGREIQMSPYFIDWCFIGAPEDHVHSPHEKVSIKDLDAMVDLYKYLVKYL